ncbi:hypothetical protein SAMN02745134_00334 [Clostridium acidisoli DSM 12555]|uniref:Uncharacterized protein n=1 Tax=Clostridium acidisoli DSM 12555 TaxID=1121291 RepID=A0A1W1X0N3_9CLOT|nr:hypothetical protein [Clostridium acidisoli]SMC17457.1 hypothetical protein SAMN02745134_00334 [Clostridium acidisoli DSM 12555]
MESKNYRYIRVAQFILGIILFIIGIITLVIYKNYRCLIFSDIGFMFIIIPVLHFFKFNDKLINKSIVAIVLFGVGSYIILFSFAEFAVGISQITGIGKDAWIGLLGTIFASIIGAGIGGVVSYSVVSEQIKYSNIALSKQIEENKKLTRYTLDESEILLIRKLANRTMSDLVNIIIYIQDTLVYYYNHLETNENAGEIMNNWIDPQNRYIDDIKKYFKKDDSFGTTVDFLYRVYYVISKSGKLEAKQVKNLENIFKKDKVEQLKKYKSNPNAFNNLQHVTIELTLSSKYANVIKTIDDFRAVERKEDIIRTVYDYMGI